LHEIGEAELPLVENLKAHAVAGGHTFRSEVHAQAVDLRGGHVNGAAAVGDFVRDVLRLELRDDLRRVLFGEAAVEELIVGLARPDHQAGQTDGDGQRGDDEGDALVEGELAPETQKGLGEGFHAEAAERSGGKGERE